LILKNRHLTVETAKMDRRLTVVTAKTAKMDRHLTVVTARSGNNDEIGVSTIERKNHSLTGTF